MFLQSVRSNVFLLYSEWQRYDDVIFLYRPLPIDPGFCSVHLLLISLLLLSHHVWRTFFSFVCSLLVASVHVHVSFTHTFSLLMVWQFVLQLLSFQGIWKFEWKFQQTPTLRKINQQIVPSTFSMRFCRFTFLRLWLAIGNAEREEERVSFCEFRSKVWRSRASTCLWSERLLDGKRSIKWWMQFSS